jgi:hypothetical protein
LRLHLPAVVLLIAGLSSACTSIPKTPPYAPSVGVRSCNDLRHAASDRATGELLLGTAVALVGLVGVGAGTVMGASADPNGAPADKYGYLLIVTPSVVAAVAGVAMINSSFKTERLESQTAAVLADGKNETDRSLYYQCVSARADWSGDHSDLARIQINMMKENLTTAQDAQATAAGATTSAQSAMTLSAEAKASATKASQIASASAEATRDLAAVTEMLVETGPRKTAEPVARTTKPAAARPEVKPSQPPVPHPDTPALVPPPSPSTGTASPHPAPASPRPLPAPPRLPPALNEQR